MVVPEVALPMVVAAVPVVLMLVAPRKRTVPATSRLLVGRMVPMPTLPLLRRLSTWVSSPASCRSLMSRRVLADTPPFSYRLTPSTAFWS